MTKFPREVTHMNFTNPRAEKSRSQSKNNQENQFRISYTATGQELIYGYVPVGAYNVKKDQPFHKNDIKHLLEGSYRFH